MAFTFQPVLYHPTLPTTIHIPKPIEQCQVKYGWSGKKHEVAKKDGQSVYGITADSAIINIAGKTSKQDTTVLTEESDMWDAFSSIVSMAELAKTVYFETFLYYPNAGDPSPEYVKFKDCWIQSFVPEIGKAAAARLSYSLTIVANDPQIYTTAPGS